MPTEHFIRTAALVVLLASCSETNKNPAEPSPGIPSSASSNKLMLRSQALTTTTTAAPARHNPRSQGIYKVTCFEGATDSPGGGFLGVCQRFSPTLDGAEINTFVQGPNGSYAGVTQASNFIRGRLLTGVVNLNFSYAGGPHAGGAPRLSIPIDDATDGIDGQWDYFAFMDAAGCNDGDEFVGRIEGKSDSSCLVNANGIDYPNWSAFVSAHPGSRIATNAVTFIIVDQPAHYLIWRVQIN